MGRNLSGVTLMTNTRKTILEPVKRKHLQRLLQSLRGVSVQHSDSISRVSIKLRAFSLSLIAPIVWTA